MRGFRAIAGFLIRRGFLVVFFIVFLFFSVVTRHFFEIGNLSNIFSAMAPLAIAAAGLALVVMSGRLDISIGSIAFLSCAIGALLMRASGLSPVLAALASLMALGLIFGAANYAKAAFVLNTNGGNGSVSPIAGGFQLYGNDSGFGSKHFTTYLDVAPVASTFAYDWAYNSLDAPGFDAAGYVVNNVFTELTNFSGTSGSVVLNVLSFVIMNGMGSVVRHVS